MEETVSQLSDPVKTGRSFELDFMVVWATSAPDDGHGVDRGLVGSSEVLDRVNRSNLERHMQTAEAIR